MPGNGSLGGRPGRTRSLPAALLAALLPVPFGAAAARPVTVDDLMGLRSIADVRISPDGRQIAYVVSRPSLKKDEHEAVLYLVSASGGAPARLTYGTRLFNKPRPAPTAATWPIGSSPRPGASRRPRRCAASATSPISTMSRMPET
ncbi:MAG TPA: LpqB family beta-propeller domain-containing protein [Thermoanaerobaculia bacterium]|nr:LpqB family beta-propeller domain-containing protein [Thermoanaerobaculia bacterium]